MAAQTLNYNLVKPAPSDYYNIEDFNRNSDLIDAALKEVSDRAELANNSIPSIQQAIFKQEGTFTFTVPKTTVYIVECVGGGGGCTMYNSITGGYMGGGGAYVRQKVSLAAGQNVTVTVGAPGVIASSGSAKAGGASSFGSYATAPGGRTDMSMSGTNNMPAAGEIRLPGNPVCVDAGSSTSYSMGIGAGSRYGTPSSFVLGSSTSSVIGQYGEGAGVGAVYLAATGISRPATPGIVIVTYVA